MAKSTNINPPENEMSTDIITREIACIKRLREDVLLLRFHLTRRTDLAKSIDPGALELAEVQTKRVLIANFMMPFSGFFWALVGSYVFILMRFRRFGAVCAFDPAQARNFKARILSGSITTAVLLYFIFGGEKPWAENWEVNLPLWGFIVGYAGKLQVDILSRMVERVQAAIRGAVGKNSQNRQGTLTGQGTAADENTPSPAAVVPREPKTEDPEVEIAK